MRERLIQLIKQAHMDYWLSDDCTDGIYEFIADRLIENGAILPSVRVRQTVYRVGDPIKKIYEWDVKYIEVYEDEIEYVDDSDNKFTADDIGKTVFLTREAAEVAMKAGEKQ